MTWTLIILVYTGQFSSDGAAVTTVPGFTSQAACEVAGKETKKMECPSPVYIKTQCVQVK